MRRYQLNVPRGRGSPHYLRRGRTIHQISAQSLVPAKRLMTICLICLFGLLFVFGPTKALAATSYGGLVVTEKEVKPRLPVPSDASVPVKDQKLKISDTYELPNMGEVVLSSLSMLGVLIFLTILIYLLFCKKQKDRREADQISCGTVRSTRGEGIK